MYVIYLHTHIHREMYDIHIHMHAIWPYVQRFSWKYPCYMFDVSLSSPKLAIRIHIFLWWFLASATVHVHRTCICLALLCFALLNITWLSLAWCDAVRARDTKKKRTATVHPYACWCCVFNLRFDFNWTK